MLICFILCGMIVPNGIEYNCKTGKVSLTARGSAPLNAFFLLCMYRGKNMFIPYGRIILCAWLHISNHAGGTDNKFFYISNDLLSSYDFHSTISLNNEPDSYIIWCDPEDEGSMFLQKLVSICKNTQYHNNKSTF